LSYLKSQVNVKLNLAIILQQKAHEDPKSCKIKAAQLITDTKEKNHVWFYFRGRALCVRHRNGPGPWPKVSSSISTAAYARAGAVTVKQRP